jgi:pimeloyl-ACP methyl ester carboxylesterase
MSFPTTPTIRPFTVAVPDAELDDLRDRLARTRRSPAPGAGWERGVPQDYLDGLARYWAEEYDWRAHEAELNALPQFLADFDGQPVHFLHVRSPEPDALPLILTHGWPSSPVEFLRVIGPLTDPRAHGGDPAAAFHVVVPSLPGYGFSTPMREGWGNLFTVAVAWAALMTELGYERFAVHGTDAGSGVAGILPMVAPGRVVGTHIAGTAAAMPFGPPLELEGLEPADRARAERFNAFREEGTGYLLEMATRPATIGHLLADSPAGLLAWMTEKFREWTDPAAALPEDAVDRDQLLTQVSIAWFTGAGADSAHAVYEGMQAWRAIEAAGDGEHGGGERPPGPPEAVSAFAAGEHPPRPPQSVSVFAADTTIRTLLDPQGEMRWIEHPCGGHFPAMETPELLVGDLRAVFAAR